MNNNTSKLTKYNISQSTGTYFFEFDSEVNVCCGSHLHRHPELIYVHKGECIIYLGAAQVPHILKDDQFLLILSNQIHSYASPKESFATICIFSESYVPSFFKQFHGKNITTKAFTCKKTIVDFVKSELFEQKKVPEKYIIKSVLYAMMSECYKSISFLNSKIKNQTLIDQIIQYVNENYTENISLKKLAKDLGYEYHYLSKYFHQHIPINFSEYINWHRINYAVDLLQTSDLSVIEIAELSGFQSLRNFNHIYKKYLNGTPSNHNFNQ